MSRYPTLAAAMIAAALPFAAGSASADPPAFHPADVRGSVTIRLGDGAFDRVYAHPYYAPYAAARKARREERIERRLEGRFVGQYRREIRRSLRDLGFRAIDVDRRGRGFDVFAVRNGHDFAFRVGRRSGRIVAAERF
ncbi:MAG: hypothetical protein AAFR52_17570 [Pseudomonadota bacterium]